MRKLIRVHTAFRQKLIILLALFTIFPSCLFASNDTAVFFNLNASRQNYLDANGGLYREEKQPEAGIALSNYNLFLCTEHLGIFESLNFLFSDGITAETSFGIAAGAPLSPKIRIQGGPAFHFSSRFFSENEEPATDIRFGLSHHFQTKIAVWKCLSAAAGISVSTDFYRLVLSKSDNIWYYSRYNHFFCISFNGFLGICIDFGGL